MSTGGSAPTEAARVQAAAARMRGLLEAPSEDVVRIRSAGAKLAILFDEEGQPVRRALVDAVVRSRHIGWPPSFVRLAGVGDLEKPFNRLLGWWARPLDHGAGYAFLLQLARKLDFPTMAEDLEGGEAASIRVEDGFDEDIGKEPDLVVLTPRAGLMLENKVHAGESGDQYGPYLAQFRKECGDRHWQAVLAARDRRDQPKGWTSSIEHADIAKIFHELARDETLRFWTRIAAVMTAVAFADAGTPEDLLAEAELLLARTTDGLIGPIAAIRMAQLVTLMPQTEIGGSA